MCRIFILIGILLYSVYFSNGTKTWDVVHSIKKRQSPNAYEITIDSDSIRNLASGLQTLLNTVQQSNGMSQMGQFHYQSDSSTRGNQGNGQNYPGGSGEYGPPGSSHGYHDRSRGHTPGRGPPPGGPPSHSGFQPPGPPRNPEYGPPGPPRNPGHGPPGPPGGPGYGPPGAPGFGPLGPPGQHFGPPGFGRHPPPPPPPPYEGYPGGYAPPGWPGFGPPGWGHWSGYGPPGHQGPPGPPPDFGRYPPPPPPSPPFEGGMYQGSPYPPTMTPNNNNNNHQKDDNVNDGKENPPFIFGGNEDNDKANIVGYLDGKFPIILLADNEIRR